MTDAEAWSGEKILTRNPDNSSVLLPLAAAFCVLRPVAFPPTPLVNEVRRGAAVYVAGKGIDRVLLEDRSVIGTWFDGRIHRDVEDVLWISPSFVSRWLGYLEAQEKWPQGVLEARWQALRPDLDGRLSFIVRLSSFPRIVDPEFGSQRKADAAEVDNVRFSLTSGAFLPAAGTARTVPKAIRLLKASSDGGGLNLLLHAAPLRRSQGRSWREFEAVPWYSLVPFGDLVWPEFATAPPNTGLALGGHFAGWYGLSLPVPETLRTQSAFELRVFSPRKERVAQFNLVR